jgi:hypothetical protein
MHRLLVNEMDMLLDLPSYQSDGGLLFCSNIPIFYVPSGYLDELKQGQSIAGISFFLEYESVTPQAYFFVQNANQPETPRHPRNSDWYYLISVPQGNTVYTDNAKLRGYPGYITLLILIHSS